MAPKVMAQENNARPSKRAGKVQLEAEEDSSPETNSFESGSESNESDEESSFPSYAEPNMKKAKRL
jgi:hypothetical protein